MQRLTAFPSNVIDTATDSIEETFMQIVHLGLTHHMLSRLQVMLSVRLRERHMRNSRISKFQTLHNYQWFNGTANKRSHTARYNDTNILFVFINACFIYSRFLKFHKQLDNLRGMSHAQIQVANLPSCKIIMVCSNSLICEYFDQSWQTKKRQMNVYTDLGN